MNEDQEPVQHTDSQSDSHMARIALANWWSCIFQGHLKVTPELKRQWNNMVAIAGADDFPVFPDPDRPSGPLQ
jgi:hypothetical protein